jgi:choline dehydrogenase-like flavoprotein
VIVDANRIPASGISDRDVCIIGAGAAGITLALELESTGQRITVIEAGGLEYDAACQRLLDGEASGDRYPSLRDTRLSALGGSTGVWAGYCRPLEATDFESRDGTVGWPFGRNTLDPFYRRAHEICDLGAFEYDADYWQSRLRHPLLLAGNQGARNLVFQVNALHFGARYRQRLEVSRNIELVLRAPVMRLHMSPARDRVERITVRSLDGHGFEVHARRFVLAVGGIENARLLLLSGGSPEQVPGNGSGLVGRYFTDHPFVDPGYLLLTGGALRLDHYFPQPAGAEGSSALVRGALSLDPAVLERDHLQGGAVLFYPRYEAHEAFATAGVKDFLEAISKFRGKSVPGETGLRLARAMRAPHQVAIAMLRKLLVADGPARRWRLRAMFETESQYDNRVTLGRERDELGRPQARVEWRLSERDLRSMRLFMHRLDESFRRASLGHVELGFDDDISGWRGAAIGGKHHMGTTRMHRDATQGVVDPDALVHGTSNLFIAGSSVFPGGGFANPTLTIVALAIRLADHLKQLR